MNNSSESDGGAIWVGFEATVSELTDSVINTNQASYLGDGLYCDIGAFGVGDTSGSIFGPGQEADSCPP